MNLFSEQINAEKLADLMTVHSRRNNPYKLLTNDMHNHLSESTDHIAEFRKLYS